MKVSVIGIGMGNPALMTLQAQEKIKTGQLLIGAKRMLDCFPEWEGEKITAALPEKIAAVLKEKEPDTEQAVIVVSGDTGFYSAAKKIPPLLPRIEVELICGISSLQYFCAKLNETWDDVKVVSLHGRDGDLLGTVSQSVKTFVLTGGEHTVEQVCLALKENGFGDLEVAAGENLSYADEKISFGKADVFADKTFSPLSVLMVFNPQAKPFSVGIGISDRDFLRGEVPMTKAEVRAVSLAKLKLHPGQVLWDVGAGTGSVSIEGARLLGNGQVYAVEQKPEAITLLHQNRERFHCTNLHIIEGHAPEALEALPPPDAVFIGGSSGNLKEIIAFALNRNPKARIVVNAITLETLSATLNCFKAFSLPDPEAVQVAVTKARPVSSFHMMTAQNPVFICSAGGCYE